MEKRIPAIILLLGIFLTACASPEMAVTEPVLSSPTSGSVQTTLIVITPTEAVQATPTPGEDNQPAPTQPEPTMEISVIDMSIVEESDEQMYTIDIVYPLLEGDPEKITVFNEEINTLFEIQRDVFLNTVKFKNPQRDDEWIEPHRKEETVEAFSKMSLQYDLTFEANGVISVHMPITTHMTLSELPNTTSFSYSYDTVSGKFLVLRDLFQSEWYQLTMFYPIIEAELTALDFGYYPGTGADVLRIRTNWNILPEGLRFNFDAYEVGPGIEGPQFVVIPWEVFSGLLDLNGPAGRIVEDN